MAGTIKNYSGMVAVLSILYDLSIGENNLQSGVDTSTWKDINGTEYTRVGNYYKKNVLNTNINIFAVNGVKCSKVSYDASDYTTQSETGSATYTMLRSSDKKSVTYLVSFIASETTTIDHIDFYRPFYLVSNSTSVNTTTALSFAYVFDTPVEVTAGETYVFNVTITPTI